MDACRYLLENFSVGPVSCVSDSYDLYGCCRDIWGNKLKELILKRGNSPLLVRPDSGDPAEVVVKVCLYVWHHEQYPSFLKLNIFTAAM